MKTYKVKLFPKDTKLNDPNFKSNIIEVQVTAKNAESVYSKLIKTYPQYKGWHSYGGPIQVRTTDDTLTVKNSDICPKCNGTGYINKFIQYNAGVCYCCNGVGRIKTK